MSALNTPFKDALDIPASKIKKENEIKGIHFLKGRSKLRLFADDLIVYAENLKETKMSRQIE